jgi:pyridoxamine 5'-phosphate oxidase
MGLGRRFTEAFRSEIEFWSGHTSRLHDRFRYLLQDNGEWKIDRLSP